MDWVNTYIIAITNIFEEASKVYILYYFRPFLFNLIALSITFVSNKHNEVA